MPNPFIHMELQTQNPTKSRAFYDNWLDWKMEDIEIEGSNEKYTMIHVGDGTGGGMMKHPVNGEPSIWVPFIDVSGIEEMTSRAEKLGAKILKRCKTVPNFGKYSVIEDPTGAIVGIWERHSI